MNTGLKFKLKELKLAHWATFPVFFGQVSSAYEGIGTVSSVHWFVIIIHVRKLEVHMQPRANSHQVNRFK